MNTKQAEAALNYLAECLGLSATYHSNDVVVSKEAVSDETAELKRTCPICNGAGKVAG